MDLIIRYYENLKENGVVLDRKSEAHLEQAYRIFSASLFGALTEEVEDVEETKKPIEGVKKKSIQIFGKK